ncbi:MAG: ABC transporter permease [Gemmatimonadota bacterium]|jgi:putative ABC transport system permease protein
MSPFGGSGPRPPRFARFLLLVTADPRQRAAQLGDLQEEFDERAAAAPSRARSWYWRQVLGSVVPNLSHRLRVAKRSTLNGRGDGMMRSGLHNVRFALRGVVRHPSFSSMVILTLALGIGATVTVFSAVYGLVLNPFPFPEPDRIVGVGTAYPRLGDDLGFWENMSPAEYTDVRDATRTLEDVVAWDMGHRQIAGDGPPQNVFTGFWWGNALRTLGMKAYLGRGFTDDEVARGDAVVLLSYRIWRDRFGADSSMVGGKILVNGSPQTLVGILPPGVEIYGMDLWTTMAVQPDRYPRNRRQFQMMARTRPGVSLQEVNTELNGIARRVERDHVGEFEEYQGWSLRAVRWNAVVSQTFRTGAFVVLGAVGFVLLLVCANIANLLLARAQRRRREMAVRTAMGAGRGLLLGQLLTESLILALLGGAAGVGLAYLGAAGLRSFLATLSLPIAGSVKIDGVALAFTAALATGAGVLFGLVPAFQSSRTEIAGTLQAEGKGATAGVSRQRLQRFFVGLEVALAFVLLAGGGLLINSFVRVNRVDPGFDHASILTMRLTLPREKYQGSAVPTFFRTLAERMEAVPGVRSAAAGTQFPPLDFSSSEVWFDGAAPSDDATLPRAFTTVVTHGYFETLGLPVREGRVFDGRDRGGSPYVAVINEAAARRYYRDQDPLGKRLKLGGPDSDNQWFEIIGVVGSARNRGVEQPAQPEIFALHDQLGGTQNQLFLLLRTEVEPRSVLPAVRRAVAEMDPGQPIYAIQTVDQAFAQSISSRRATTLFLSIFGVFALILAAVGIYAVVSFTVSERTQEIGLRVALGADGGRVRRLVVGQALLPVLIGAGVGIGLALPLGGLLQRLLYEISGNDPATLSGVAALLIGVAALASFVPAWRASRLDPVEALRVE